MEYSIKELSQFAGVSARTLRYYDQIGLLRPSRVSETGYRFYGKKEVELLQQILFYRERGLKLERIAEILYTPQFDEMAALKEHLAALERRQEHTGRLIAAVKMTIASMKGEITMSDREKFAAFKQEMVKENEKKYGKEIREKYGEEKVEASNRKMLNMTEEEYERFEKLGQDILNKLKNAVTSGESPEGEAGREIALLHKEWLGCTWEKYSVDAHRGIVDMYLADPRFTAYYDEETPGCAEFLNRAVKRWI